jgi:hypothetical protein
VIAKWPLFHRANVDPFSIERHPLEPQLPLHNVRIVRVGARGQMLETV